MSSNPTFVNDMDLFGNRIKQIPCIVGEGSPTSDTYGAVGMLYMDTSSNNGEMYKCIKVEDGKYTWEKLVSEDSGENAHNVFSGRTASFYGDSLTEVNYHYTKGYHAWLAELLGLSSYNNNGVSGYKVSDVLNKVESGEDNSDITFVMVGVNDRQFDVPLGTLDNLENGTVYGNLNALCEKLREKYPTRPLVFITPAEQTKYPGTIGVSMFDIATAVKNVCARHAIVVYDNYEKSEIHGANLSYWTTDNCHWNDKAHEMVGRNLAHFVANTFRYIPSTSGGGTKTLTGISATYSGGSVAVGTPVSALSGIVVTAYYSDGTNATVTGYTLNGTIAEGENTVTVTYQGQSATITVDGVSESGGEDTGFVGKTFVMKGYRNAMYNMTAIVAVDEDAVSGNSVSFSITGNDAGNLIDFAPSECTVFSDNTGLCSNSAYAGTVSGKGTVTTAVDDAGNVTASAVYTINATINVTYLKVPITFKPENSSSPAQFTIDQISVTVNGKEKEILAIGGFFSEETYEII